MEPRTATKSETTTYTPNDTSPNGQALLIAMYYVEWTEESWQLAREAFHLGRMFQIQTDEPFVAAQQNSIVEIARRYVRRKA